MRTCRQTNWGEMLGTKFVHFSLPFFLTFLSLCIIICSKTYEVNPFSLSYMEYLINEVIVMEVLPLQVLTPLFPHIWQSKRNYICKPRRDSTFSAPSQHASTSQNIPTYLALSSGFSWFPFRNQVVVVIDVQLQIFSCQREITVP